ncbi:MAG: transcriptional regulator [Phormidesmis sp.]
MIETEAEYERALAIVESLVFKQDRTPEETAIYRLFTTLVEAYEAENYSMQEPLPHEVLLHILSSSGTQQSELVGVLGSDHAVSEIINGERAIDRTQAKILGELFKVSPSLFVPYKIV